MREDCFYFMTSSCARGSACTFRHSTAAKNSSTTCSNWTNGIECPDSCMYRHSNYQNKEKKGVPCYWESRGGCKKKDCPYVHWEKTPHLLDLTKIDFGAPVVSEKEMSKEFSRIKTVEELERDLKDLSKY
ncbi:hypothetical protein NEHOM01_0639 [Nematocida homosporus]|uniref:uncharacterized protein n=1 Tax=Nematocida homosporus TaxID=1912981 RepID=UPI00222023F8|nr:uncharacterized protein NEHOM01_0639 [Nematocida homosporus]KAI5185134.1 hypothetical protein NEHOM01_0639 [Nematocida homosporus]